MNTVEIIHDIKRVDKFLKKYWGNKASKEKPVKSKLKIVVICLEGKSEEIGYIYAYDINDGYFHECILDDLVTGTEEELNKKIAERLIKKLIDYCKKNKIEVIRANIEKEERSLFKKMKFEIDNKISARYEV